MEYYEELMNKSRDRSDRYRNCKILKDRETGETLLATREITEISKKSDDLYHRISSHEVNRLDILAHIYYKNPLLWWVIAQANNIYDPLLPIEIGTLIRIPSLESLYGHDGILL